LGKEKNVKNAFLFEYKKNRKERFYIYAIIMHWNIAT